MTNFCFYNINFIEIDDKFKIVIFFKYYKNGNETIKAIQYFKSESKADSILTKDEAAQFLREFINDNPETIITYGNITLKQFKKKYKEIKLY